jgi:DNA-binding GntR family transcriptional regulator
LRFVRPIVYQEEIEGSDVNEPLVRTMRSQVTSRLRERILAGTYAPGAQLLQDAIAVEFGISKIPVREALVELQGEGLVDIFAHRGFQVRSVSLEDFEEIFALRLKIEPAAVAAGARKATAADRETVNAALAKLNEALSSSAVENVGTLNRAFHVALTAPASQPITAGVLDRLHILSQRYVQLHLLPSGRIKRVAREHIALYEAWGAREYGMTEELTRTHIEAAYSDLAHLLSQATSMPSKSARRAKTRARA